MIRLLVAALFTALIFVSSTYSWEIITGDGSPTNHILSAGGKILSKGGDNPLYWHLSGLIYKSTDKGKTWKEVEYADLCVITAAQLFGKSGIALAADSTLYGEPHKPFLTISLDAGKTWSAQSTSSLFQIVSCIAEAGEDLIFAGFVSTDLVVATYNNTGKKWTKTLTVDSAAEGLIWYGAPSAPPVIHQIGSKSFLLVFGKGGTVVMPEYEVYLSNDNGKTWTKQKDISDAAKLYKVKVLSPKFYYSVSANYKTWNKSIDGGKTWVVDSIYEKTGMAVSDIAFGDSLHGVAINGAAIMTTKNGGKKWSVDTVTVKKYKEQQLSKNVFAIDPTHFWITGTRGLLLRSGYDGSAIRENISYKSMSTQSVLRLSGNTLIINDKFTGGVLKVFSIDGKMVCRIVSVPEKMSIMPFSLQPGTYIGSVEKNDLKATAKIRF